MNKKKNELNNKNIYIYKDAMLYKITRPIITILFKLVYRPKIEGKENIPNTGKIILAGNHTNNFDCLLLISSTKRSIHFLAKDELWHGPKKIIFSNMGLIPVNRRQKDPKSIKLAEAYLQNNQLIGIFPEGTFERQKGKVMDFKIGAVKMAHDTGSKIVPFAITGKYKIFSKDLKIKFFKPITIKDDLTKENERLRSIIKNEVEGE